MGAGEVDDDSVEDDEIVYRRVPPGATWIEPPKRMTSANFKLRPDERGLSVYRSKVVTPHDVLSKPGAVAGSLLSAAIVSEIRALTNAAGQPLGLDVIAVDDANDPGHAEIRGPGGRLSPAASKALKKLFKILEP